MCVQRCAGLVLLLVALTYGQVPLQEVGQQVQQAQQIPPEQPGISVSESCLGCICEAVSNCNQTVRCEGDVCGVFRITKGYWIDAGQIALQQDNTDGYQACTLDPICAGRVVRSYMSRFAQDCNNDGVVNCDDFAAIHRLGGYGCRNPLDQGYLNKYFSCKQQTLSFGGSFD